MEAATSTPTTVKLADLVIDPAENPRGPINPESIEGLAASMKTQGVLTPLLVEATDDGYRLTAGYRRAAAAKQAGLTEVPVHVRSLDNRESAAYTENEQREDMTPMARARSLKRQLAHHGTQKALAAEVGISPKTVSQLIAMTRLPDEVQKEVVACHQFGPATAAALLPVTKVAGGNALALALAKKAVTSDEWERALRTELPHALDTLAEGVARGSTEVADETTVSRMHGIELDRLGYNDAERQEWADRITELADSGVFVPGIRTYDGGAAFSLDSDATDRLRAAGALFEIEVDNGGWKRTHEWVFDLPLLRTEVEVLIEAQEKRVEKELAKQEKANAKKADAEGESGKPEQSDRQRQHAERKAAKAHARSRNGAIGQALSRRAKRAPGKRRVLDVVKVMAHATVLCDDKLAAAGLRLTDPVLSEVEVTTSKTGKRREKITYADPDEATAYLLRQIDAATSTEQIVQAVSDALVAAHLTDEAELPKAKRVKGDPASPRFLPGCLDQDARDILAQEEAQIVKAIGDGKEDTGN